MKKFIYILSIAAIISGCNIFSRGYEIGHNDMQNHTQLRWEEDSTVLVFAGNEDLPTIPLQLERGKYSIRFRARGSASAGITPHFVIRLGDYTIKDMHIGVGLNSYQFNFELPERADGSLRFIFDNDHSDETGDRNVFLHYPVLIEPF